MPISKAIPVLSEYSDEQLFQLVNLVLPAWALLAIAPKSKVTSFVVFSVASILSILYALTLYEGVADYGGFGPAMEMFTKYEGVVQIFGNKKMALIGWVHYGVTDLMTGYWEAQDGAERGIPRLIMLACLFMSMMFGPCGVILYFVVRSFFSKPAPRRKSD